MPSVWDSLPARLPHVILPLLLQLLLLLSRVNDFLSRSGGAKLIHFIYSARRSVDSQQLRSTGTSRISFQELLVYGAVNIAPVSFSLCVFVYYIFKENYL